MPDFSALPALNIKGFDALGASQAATDYQTRQTLLPGYIQSEQDKSALEHTGYGNSMLAQAANEASLLGPDEAPAAFDASMNKLAETNPMAKQYVGHYSPELATKLKTAFGPGDSNSAAAAPPNPQLIQQVAQIPAPLREQTLAETNKIIAKYHAVNSADDLEAEVTQLAKDNPGMAKSLAGIDFTKKDRKSFTENYALVGKLVANLTAQRDALQGLVSNDALGISSAPPVNPKVVGNYVVDLNNPSKPLFSPPVQGDWEITDPDKTGTAPMLVNKKDGTVKPFTPENAAAAGFTQTPAASQISFAQKINGSESSGNPNAQSNTSSAGGINGMIDATYVTQARKLLPALKNVSDKDILALKKSGQLTGLNTDMTVSQNQDDAAVLQKNNLPVNNASVALMYKLGAGDGMKVIKAIATNPDTPLSKIITPAALKANPDFANQTAGTYVQGLIKQFGTDPYGQGTQAPSGQKVYGKFDEPKQLEYTDKDGNDVQVLAQQNKLDHKWYTADGQNTVINPGPDVRIVPPATGGGRNAMMISRALTDAKDAAAEIDNLSRLPISANAGWAGMRAAHGDGSIIGSSYNVMANKLTDQEAQDMNVTMVGMGKALAGLQTGGTAGAGGKALMDQYEKLAVQKGDSYITSMRKLASMRQASINAIESNMSGSFVNPAQKKQFQEAEDMIKKAVPWTPNDVTDFERAGKKNPELSFQEYAAKKGVGGVPQAKYHMGDIVKGFRFKGGDWQNKNNWEKAT